MILLQTSAYTKSTEKGRTVVLMSLTKSLTTFKMLLFSALQINKPHTNLAIESTYKSEIV